MICPACRTAQMIKVPGHKLNVAAQVVVVCVGCKHQALKLTVKAA